MSRWTLREVGTTVTYDFVINPNEFQGPSRQRNVVQTPVSSSSGRVLIFEGSPTAPTITFSGTVLEQADYEALETWTQKQTLVDMFDDLGRSFRVSFTNFQPQRRISRLYPWRHDYTVEAVVIA